MQVFWSLLGSFFFAAMGVCIKFATEHFNSFETVFYRGVVGMVFLWSLARWRGVSLATSVPMMHVWRSLVGTISLTGWFYAIALLPLATAMTLNYMSSVWIATFLLGGAVIMQGRGAPVRGQAVLFLTVIVGFLGVALLLRPSFNPSQALAGLVGLMSGLFAALAYLQVAALAKVGEPESRTVFYFSVGTTISGALGMAFVGVSPWHWPGALWLLPIGLLAVGGQLCLTRSYAQGASMVIANMQYSGIVFAALFGLTVFGEHLPLMGWIGMGLIVLSGIAATALRSRAVPQSPPPEP